MILHTHDYTEPQVRVTFQDSLEELSEDDLLFDYDGARTHIRAIGPTSTVAIAVENHEPTYTNVAIDAEASIGETKFLVVCLRKNGDRNQHVVMRINADDANAAMAHPSANAFHSDVRLAVEVDDSLVVTLDSGGIEAYVQFSDHEVMLDIASDPKDDSYDDWNRMVAHEAGRDVRKGHLSP